MAIDSGVDVQEYVLRESFRRGFVEALEADADFQRQMKWYDGRVLLELGPASCYVKIYCGRVIDINEEPPAMGYTVKITGPADAWQAFIDGRRSFEYLATPGRRDFDDGRPISTSDAFEAPAIWMEGDGMEAMRVFEGLVIMCEVLRRIVQEGGTQ